MTATPAAGVAPALRAAAVEPLAERLRAAGWAVEGPHDGGHERRIELRDPSGNPLVRLRPAARLSAERAGSGPSIIATITPVIASTTSSLGCR